MLYEIRDYHYRRDLFQDYVKWAEEAVIVLRQKLDVVGFWIDEGEFEPQLAGCNPQPSSLGGANVTWILRWESKAQRDAVMKTAFTGEAWETVMAKHPDPKGYLQMASRFMRDM